MSPRRRALRRRCRANFWRCSRRSKDAHCGGELTPPLQRRGLYGSNRRGAHYVTAMTKYLHTMIRVTDPDATVAFFKLIGLNEVRRFDNEAGRFTLIFLAPPGQEGVAEVELTWNWPPADGSAPETYAGGRNFGHLAYRVDNIYATCQHDRKSTRLNSSH